MENARLHQEMASMRDSFFRKMRGGKRFVSGGGFRTGGFPQNDPSEKKKNGQEKNLKAQSELFMPKKSGWKKNCQMQNCKFDD